MTKKQYHKADLCLTVILSFFLWQLNATVCAVERNPRKNHGENQAPAPQDKPSLLVQAPARYPQFALNKCLDGNVWLSVYVSTSGAVSDVKTAVASDSTSGFIEAAINAAWKSEFSPAIVNDKEKAMWTTMTYRFTVPIDCQPLPADSLKPRPGVFVAYEVQPKFLERVTPKYPRKALENCIEGKVWVQVLIDKSGMVRDVKISKASGTNVGFEKAAKKAAMKSKFSPAIQSGRPIAVWATFPFEFKPPHDCAQLHQAPQAAKGLTVDPAFSYDSPPVFRKKSSPVYPTLAKRAGIGGTVWVGVFVERSGKVTDVRIDKSSGANAGFEDAAMKAAWQCKFAPATKDGKPVATWVSFPFQFKFEKR